MLVTSMQWRKLSLISHNALYMNFVVLFGKNMKQYEVIVKPRAQTPKPKTEGPWATTPPHPITFEHDGRVPQKKSKSKKGSEFSSKKLRWTARGRKWSSQPCSVRTSSILLVASLSKCQHSGKTNLVQEGPNAGLLYLKEHGGTV